MKLRNALSLLTIMLLGVTSSFAQSGKTATSSTGEVKSTSGSAYTAGATKSGGENTQTPKNVYNSPRGNDNHGSGYVPNKANGNVSTQRKK